MRERKQDIPKSIQKNILDIGADPLPPQTEMDEGEQPHSLKKIK